MYTVRNIWCNMATVSELIQSVGEELALVPIGQALDAQDELKIEQTYTSVYARLKEHGIAGWTSTGDVPDAAVPYVVTLICDRLLNTYGVPPARYQRIKTEAGIDGREALKNLASVVALETEDFTEPTDF